MEIMNMKTKTTSSSTPVFFKIFTSRVLGVIGTILSSCNEFCPNPSDKLSPIVSIYLSIDYFKSKQKNQFESSF